MLTVSTRATSLPLSVAGFPIQAWAFAIRIWIAAVVALLTGFWLQLEVPSTAMITVMILAEPTRGQALQKAGYRLFATVLGVGVSIAIVGALSQTTELLLLAFAAWMGLCVYACGVLDGYRAYAAVLSGYTVALLAIQQIDNPLHVFTAGMERGAAIAVGVFSITLVNDLLLAPDRHLQLETQLASLHRRVRNYAQAVMRGQFNDEVSVAALIRDIVGLRPDISSLVGESSSGPVRSAAARSATVSLVTELQAVRALRAFPVIPDLLLSEPLISALDSDVEEPFRLAANVVDVELSATTSAALRWRLQELLRRDEEVRLHLNALRSVERPFRSWRAPLYRSQRIAIESGVRAAAWVAIATFLLVQAGWSSASVALSLLAVIVGLGATTPAPRMFTTLGLVGAPIAIALTGILEFFVLNGVSDFPLLVIGLAPFLIGAALLSSLPNPALSSIGKVNLIFISAVLAASNPQTYNPQSFLFTSLFVCIAVSLLLALQYLIPPVSDDQRRSWLLASAQHELCLVPGADGGLAPEEATFRDAVRVGQIVAAGPSDPGYRASVEQALVCFDQAAALRFAAAELAWIADRDRETSNDE
jgi:uncharacterized membrane protein YccC